VSKGERTRQRIVETAAGLMNRSGWLATPVSAVLAATGLKKGGLYNHFVSLDDLAAQAFDHASGQMVAVIEQRLATDGTAPERLLNLLAAFEHAGQPPFASGCPILNAATETDDMHEPMRQRVAAVVSHILALLEGVIRDGRTAGEFSADVEPRRAAQLLFAAFEGGVMLAGVLRQPVLFSEIKNDLEALIASWAQPRTVTP
jgi:TetR/AcrR family transcriptional regulator, transcriptional repressor for nem operon